MQSQLIYDRKALRTSAFLLLLTAAQGAFAGDGITNGFVNLVQWASGLMSILVALYWLNYARAAMAGHHHGGEKMEGMVIGSAVVVGVFTISTLFRTWFS